MLGKLDSKCVSLYLSVVVVMVVVVYNLLVLYYEDIGEQVAFNVEANNKIDINITEKQCCKCHEDEGRKNEEISNIFWERQYHVQKMCVEHHREINEKYKVYFPKNNYENVLENPLFRRIVLENRKVGFLWCKVPKVASVSWNKIFIKSWFPESVTVREDRQQAIIESNWKPKDGSAAYLKMAAKSSFSFMTSRHPFERLLSAYRDKFFLSGLTPSFEREKVNGWYNRYGKGIIEKYRKIEPTDPKYKAAPTFREFVEFLVELPVTQFDTHWQPIHMLCMPCHIQYSIIARMETLPRDSDQIFKSIGLSAHLPVSHITGNTTLSTVASYYSDISKDLLDKLYDIYKLDFLLFNYTATDFGLDH